MESDFSVQEAIEAERAQIGHELHDALLPLVAGAKYSMAGFVADLPEDHEDRERLQQVVTWLDEAMVVGRQILIHAYPPELDDIPWAIAAKQTIDAIVDESAQVDWRLSEDSDLYSTSVAGAVYRIVVEATRNALRHGKASQIAINANGSTVEISDNGCGFDPDSIPDDRYGVRSMKGRATLIQGSLEVLSSEGQGTTIKLTLPETRL